MPDFEIVERTEQPTAVVHEIVPTGELPQFFSRAFGQAFSALQAQGLTPAGPPFALYFGLPGDEVEVEAGFPATEEVADQGPVHAGLLPGGRCAHAVHVGPYDSMSRTYAELQQWMREQHLHPHEEMVEVYLSDPKEQPDPAYWRTEILWPVD